ncbi:hypothetical protein MJ560_22750 [Klebsiella pneumoniae]|nr:hypothetical protein MJ560_22750 [Klebsiella pneumoniae]
MLEVMRYTRALAQEGVTLFGVAQTGDSEHYAGGRDRHRPDRQRCGGRWSGLAL